MEADETSCRTGCLPTRRPSDAFVNALAALSKSRSTQMATSPSDDARAPPPPSTSPSLRGGEQRSRSHPPPPPMRPHARQRSRSRTPPRPQRRSRSRTPPRLLKRSRSRTPPRPQRRSRSLTPPCPQRRSRSRTPPRPQRRSRSRTPTPPRTQDDVYETDTIWVSEVFQISGDASKRADAENELRAKFNRFGKISKVAVMEKGYALDVLFCCRKLTRVEGKLRASRASTLGTLL